MFLLGQGYFEVQNSRSVSRLGLGIWVGGFEVSRLRFRGWGSFWCWGLRLRFWGALHFLFVWMCEVLIFWGCLGVDVLRLRLWGFEVEMRSRLMFEGNWGFEVEVEVLRLMFRGWCFKVEVLRLGFKGFECLRFWGWDLEVEVLRLMFWRWGFEAGVLRSRCWG